MKFVNPFKKKVDPAMEQAYEARKTATANKMEAADKLIKLVDDLKIERRCGVFENYDGPERRTAHA